MDDSNATVPVPTPRPGSNGDAGNGERITESGVQGLLGAVPSTPRSSGPREWQPPSVEDLQRALPQYEVLAFVARGGMGAVYKGTQKTLKRAVAIKVLPPEIEDGEVQYAERFKREAQSMARLSHPNIVAVYDAGEVEMGENGRSGVEETRRGEAVGDDVRSPRGQGTTLLYFVMEFIEGTDVHQLIVSEGRLDPKHAMSITTAVCEALAFAHEEGIVHRDIKPSNIMLDKKGRVKVADFGLAKTVNMDSTLLTGSNVAMGTPDYIAPEAFITGMAMDGRADIYAVGVMFYQMLTGTVPRGRFALPSIVVPQIDPRLDAIVDKAMQTERDKRYSTATEMKADVEAAAVPMVKEGGENHAAIPNQLLPQKPVAKGPQKPMGKSANVPVRTLAAQAVVGGSDPDSPGPLDRATTAKSKAPLFIGISAVAAIGIGAFVMLSGKKPAAGDDVRNLSSNSGTSGAAQSSGGQQRLVTASPATSAPIKVREEPKPAPAVISSAPNPETPKPAPEKKEEPKPAGAAPSSPNPPISKSPTLPVSKSSDQKFPPGQWVKVFTKFEDLPPEMRKPDSGVKFEDGWIDQSQAKHRSFFIADAAFRNVGVRARIHRGPIGVGGFQVRTSAETYYRAMLGERYDKAKECTLELKASSNPEQAHVLLSRKTIELNAAGEGMLEVCAIGSRLAFRFDGELLGAVSDNTLMSGLLSYYGHYPVRDIEVINLDGIPEAEALRILGVDEKGNDVRALAAKQEEQQKARAQQVDAIAAIPELKTLHDQFVKLQTERVTAPFEADVAKLNTGYLGGIDREITKERGKGNLDGVIVLEAEKKLIPVAGVIDPGTPGSLTPATTNPIPAEDDDKTTEALKGLRKIYRAEFAKLEGSRAGNLKALTDPLSIRLKQLETTLTQQNRVPDAKVVREYRDGLAEGSAGTPARNAINGGAAAKTNEADKSVRAPLNGTTTKATIPKLGKIDERQIAQWVLDHGAELKLSSSGVIKSGQELPKGIISITDVNLMGEGPFTEADLLPIAALPKLQRFNILYGGGGITPAVIAMLAKTGSVMRFEVVRIKLPDAAFAPLADCRNLQTFAVSDNPALTGEALAYLQRCPITMVKMNRCGVTDDRLALLRHCPKLEELELNENAGVTHAGLVHLAGLGKLRKLALTATSVDTAQLSVLKECRALRILILDNLSFSSEAWAALSQLPDIEKIEARSAKVLAPDILVHLKKLPKLSDLKIANGPPLTDADMAGIGTFEKLETLWLPGGIGDATLAEVAKLPNLRELYVGFVSTTLTEEGLTKLQGMKKLKTLQLGEGPIQFTDAAIAAFKQARPDVTVVR